MPRDRTMSNEGKHRALINNEVTKTRAAKTSLSVPATSTVGATYSQAEVAALKATVDAMRAALLDSGLVK